MNSITFELVLRVLFVTEIVITKIPNIFLNLSSLSIQLSIELVERTNILISDTNFNRIANINFLT